MQNTEKTQFVKDLKDKDPVRSSFLIKYSAMAMGKNGKPYITLVLMDRTGEVDAKIFDEASQWLGKVSVDQIISVEGRCQLYLGKKQVLISDLKLVDKKQVDPKDYLKESPVDPDLLYAKLLKFVDSMSDPFYKALAECILKEDASVVEKLKKAPAAKSVHHAYPSGLLEHVVSITEILDFFSKHYYPFLDRDLLFLGGFFHDIGKLWELIYDGVVDYSDEGRLIGHHVIGVELIESKIQELERTPGKLPGPFPIDKKLLVKHVILAHHGKLEYGSPKEPACLEAIVVHMVDDLDSKMNSIRIFTETDMNTGKWTALNRQYGRYFYKPEWAHKSQS